ncbi:MAG: hypothetical protein IPM13_17095 [Phycisphaerales bacterium]|nr:hypothetical protein [Phycisphaerales bacterium]
MPASYTREYQRYLHEYGATPEQLAAIAVEHRRHASRHPQAHKRDPITIDDVMRSRVISSPLRLLDCCRSPTAAPRWWSARPTRPATPARRCACWAWARATRTSTSSPRPAWSTSAARTRRGARSRGLAVSPDA